MAQPKPMESPRPRRWWEDFATKPSRTNWLGEVAQGSLGALGGFAFLLTLAYYAALFAGLIFLAVWIFNTFIR